MTKHVHADLMAEYVKDAQETNTPHERWEYCGPESKCWQPCSNSPTWWGHFNYRRKRKTHIVNGKEVAAPLEIVKKGQIVYSFEMVIRGGSRFKQYCPHNPDDWKDELSRGLLFATEEDAKENFEAYFPIRNI